MPSIYLIIAMKELPPPWYLYQLRMEDSQKKNNAHRVTWMWLTFQSRRIQEIRIYYSKKRKERHFQRYHYDYPVRTISYNLREWKKKEARQQTGGLRWFFHLRRKSLCRSFKCDSSLIILLVTLFRGLPFRFDRRLCKDRGKEDKASTK